MTFLICSTTSVRLITFYLISKRTIYIIHHSIYYKDKHNSLQKEFFYLHILLKHLFFHKKCVITSTLYKNQ